MNSLAVWWLILFAVILATVVDLFIMKWMRTSFQKNSPKNDQKAGGVYIFGVYSPILSWLRKLWLVLPQPDQIPVDLNGAESGTRRKDSSNSSGILVSLKKVILWIEQQGEGFYILVLALGILFYCGGILSFRADLQLPGNESENFQSVMQFFIQSIFQDHQFPTWNPYLRTGLPYIADPMLHIYNPIVTLPCIVFGVRIGYRVALILSFLMAAIGIMKLGKALGFGRLISLWLGIMFVFAGQPTARFFQGEYLFIFGFAWIPWVFYFLFQYSQTKESKKLVYFSFAFAFLYFSGNAYYAFIVIWLIILFSLVFSIDVSFHPFRFHVHAKLLMAILAACILWVGMVALHFLPMLKFRPYMDKGLDVQGSHTLLQIWLDYTSTDTFRKDAYTALPAREEYYAYIGYVPFVALAFLPFGWQKGKRRWILYWIAVMVFVIIWIDVDRMPWREFFYQTAFFSQFRHVLRPLIFGSLAIFVLGAFGMDGLWKRLKHGMQHCKYDRWGGVQKAFCGMGLLGLIGLMGYGAFDTYWVNHQHLFLKPDDLAAYRVTQWLRAQDRSEYYTRHNPVNDGYLAMLTSRLKFVDAWYSYSLTPRLDDRDLARRPLQAKPFYVIQSEFDPPPEGRWQLITQMEGYSVYKMLDSLPIAFKTSLFTLQSDPQRELRNEDVTPISPLFIKNDAIEVITQGRAQDTLVILVSRTPGWQLKIDDRRAQLEQAGGYLAARMLDGIHKYRFEFRPTVFYLGLGISLICLGFGLFVIRSDLIALAWKTKKFLSKFKYLWEGIKNRRIGREKATPILYSAVFQQGILRIRNSLALEEGREVDLVVLPKENEKVTGPNLWSAWKRLTWLLIYSAVSLVSLPLVLFVFTVLIYLGTRTVNLVDFPIYFFTDEAIQTVSAADLVRDGFYGPGKVFLPTYFPNGSYWNLSLSVYVQVILYLLFGKSVFVTRFTSLFVSGFMILILVNALRKTICPRAWWSVLLFLSIMPTWFLHSRTAFETVLFSGFYAAFLGAYLLYVHRSPRYLYLAIFMAALGFYTYSPGQVILVITAVAFFVLDFRYHVQNRPYLGKGVLLAILLAVPYLRFLSYHQQAPLQHLRNLDSYWFYDLPLTEKVLRYLKEYLMGLNPYYWFFPHSIDLNRHTMKGYSHLGLWNLPFVLFGFISAIRQWRRPSLRIFLVAYLAVPSGAALVGVGITRLLAMVIPMAVFAALGWEWILSAFQGLRQQKFAQIVLFVFLCGVSFLITTDSLRNGPTWYEDYGLYGMQYGTRQIFEQKIPHFLQRDPRLHLFVSSIWANGADVFVRYFLTQEQARRVTLGSIDSYLSRKQPLDENTLFVLTAEEFRAALASPKLRFIKIEDEIHYPNGKIGFYLVRLAYVDNVDEIFARELQLRRQLMTAHVVVDGMSAKVRYSQIDAGELGNLFDQDPQTLMRGREANPYVLEFEFEQPQLFRGIQVQFGSMDFELVVILYPDFQADPIELRQEYRGLPPDPSIELIFPEEISLSKIRIEVRDLNYGEIANIHLRELKFLK